MQTQTPNQTLNCNDANWQLIAEYSLHDRADSEGFEPDLSPGSLYQTIQDFGLSTEYLKRLKLAISETARTASNQAPSGISKFPVNVYLFCEKKMMEKMQQSEYQEDGGWGYFFVTRGMESPNSACRNWHVLIELYIYREGV